MSKITITRLPNATPEYDASQFDQMVSLLDQIILLLNTAKVSTIIYMWTILTQLKMHLLYFYVQFENILIPAI